MKFQRDCNNIKQNLWIFIESPIQLIDFGCSLGAVGMELVETMETMD